MRPPPLALALHGGAGAIPRYSSRARREEVLTSLRAILTLGRDLLLDGATALDVAETVVRALEDDPLYNAGRGSVLNRHGEHELEASIMVGSSRACGAASGLRRVRNPIRLAREIMETEEQVFLVGVGAEELAVSAGLDLMEPEYFNTPRRARQLEKYLAGLGGEQVSHGDPERGTVGCVVLDGQGELVAATSTGGRTGKRRGRIGDSPVLGAGNYANSVCAISCTGLGEQFLRYTVARDVAARMEFGGSSLEEASRVMVEEVLDPGDGGLVAVDHQGNLAMPFNSPGMFRGAYSNAGVYQVGIWEETLPGGS